MVEPILLLRTQRTPPVRHKRLRVATVLRCGGSVVARAGRDRLAVLRVRARLRASGTRSVYELHQGGCT